MVFRNVRRLLRLTAGAAAVLERRLPQAPLDLSGNRAIENSWIASEMPIGPGKALDFGPGNSHLWLIAARRGFEVVGVDLREPTWFYVEPRITFMRGDIRQLDLEPASFDLILNCSSVEHVGLAGRYGVSRSEPDGDLEIMQLLRRLVKPEGVMLLTIPVGWDSVFPPLHRVYGEERLERLFEAWTIEKEEYWGKDEENRWVSVCRSAAVERVPEPALYGLGCYTLRPR